MTGALLNDIAMTCGCASGGKYCSGKLVGIDMITAWGAFMRFRQNNYSMGLFYGLKRYLSIYDPVSQDEAHEVTVH